jgi:hypothetical protein
MGTVVSNLTTLFGGLKTAVGLLPGPMGGIILVSALLAAAWYTNFGGMRDRVDELRDAFERGDIPTSLQKIGQALLSIPSGIAKEILGPEKWHEGVESWKSIGASIREFGRWFMNEIRNAIIGPARTLLNNIRNEFANLGKKPSEAGRSSGGGKAGFHDFVGSYQKGVPYLIGGSAQPELFVPNESGTAYPKGAYNLGGGDTYQVTVQITPDTIRQYPDAAEYGEIAGRGVKAQLIAAKRALGGGVAHG